MPKTNRKLNIAPLRFAHPFFTSTPPTQRKTIPAVHAARMSDWISQKLGPIPKPTREPVMDLADIIGATAITDIEKSGLIRIHASGDTSRPGGSASQEEIVLEMTKDYHADVAANNPAFFLHLGDVIYGHDKETLYRDEFYRPYKDYPGKILAIAGNHDGEIFAKTDPTPLKAFLETFCAKSATVLPVADEVRIFRETMTQPGVYWLLNCPFLQIIGLYSNIAEGPGHLEGANGDKSQSTWLAKALQSIAKERNAGKRRALVIAVHHPPYSNGGHSGSPDMLNNIDAACQQAKVMPDAFISGHAHNNQRHTRRTSVQGQALEIPFIVAGCGGHNDSSVEAATGQHTGDHTFDRSRKGFGYLVVSASSSQLSIQMVGVPKDGDRPFDTVTVSLATNKLI